MDYRVPFDVAEIANQRLITVGAAAALRRDCLAVLAIIAANLAPLSFGTAVPPADLANRLGLDLNRWREVIAALEKVNLVGRVRRRRTSGQPQTLAVRLPGERLRGRQRAYVPRPAESGTRESV